MMSTQLKKLAEQNHWRVNAEEETIFGAYNGYLFTVMEGKGFKAFFTSIAGISKDGLKALTRFLDEHHKSLRLRNFELGDNFLCIRQQESLLPLSAEKMEYLLAQLSGLLDLYELPTESCTVCGKQAETKGLYFGLLCHLHPECESAEITDYTRMTDDEPKESPEDTGEDIEDEIEDEIDEEIEEEEIFETDKEAGSSE